MSRIKLLTWFAAILVPSLCVMSFLSVGQIACPAEGRPTLYGVACINAAKYLSFCLLPMWRPNMRVWLPT